MDETPPSTPDVTPEVTPVVAGSLAASLAESERALWHLTRAAERLCTTVGPSRQRQLRWVVGELTAYQDWVRAASVAGLFSTAYLHGYLTTADEGHLRRRGPIGTPSPPGAARIRRTCVEMLAAAAGVPAPDLDAITPAGPRAKVTPMAAQRAMRVLLAEARDHSAPPGVVRAVFVATLVHHHDLRTGEIAALTMNDIEPVDVVVRLTYQPAAPGVGPGEPQSIVLEPVVAEMLDRWLVHREALIPVPRVQHLLVSVKGNHDNGAHRPAGLPLRPRGLMRAHERVIADLNETLFERYGHEPDYAPLPRTLGELRPALLGIEPTPDGEWKNACD
jgi:hypothetical protein